MTETPNGPPPPTNRGGGTSFMKKKVAGVPVIYLIGGAVLILAVFAYRTKTTKTPVTAPVDEIPPDEFTDSDGTTLPVVAGGTVTVAQPNPAAVPGTNASIVTNDDWLRAGMTVLQTAGVTPGDAQRALQAYLEGAQLTYLQGGYRDRVIKEYGLPPDPPYIVGDVPKPKPPVVPPIVVPKVPPNPTPVPAPKPVAKPVAKPIAKPVAKPVATGPKYPGYYIKSGSRGSNVVLVQKKVGATADGIFGPKTLAAVKAWQRSHGLSADGIVGPLTWDKMF